VGFRYTYDPSSRQFAHPSGIMLLTPGGRLTRYFYGIAFPSRDLRLSLVEASQGKIGSPVDQILLYCCQYDPRTGKYGLLISHVLQVAGGMTILLLGLVIGILFVNEKRGSKHHAASWK
jgi:protein SCO1/2